MAESSDIFVLNIPVSSKVEMPDPKSFMGTPLTEVQVNRLSVAPQTTGTGYDVAFEVCAAKDVVRVPLVDVSSDQEKITVKMADKIAPNSCQITGAKIMATTPDSIKVSLSDTIDRSVLVTGLEKFIEEQQNKIRAEKQAINNLVNMPAPRPADFEEQIDSHVAKIISLRTDILTAKAQLYKTLNEIYS